MGHHFSVKDLPEDGEHFDPSKVSKFSFILLVVGGSLALLSLLFFLIPATSEEFAYSWLFGFGVFFSITAGGIFWTLLHHATNSGWGTAIRRLMENLGSMMWFLAVLAVPFLFTPVQDALWEWMEPYRSAVAEHDGNALSIFDKKKMKEIKHTLEVSKNPEHYLISKKSAYMNTTLWTTRVVLYFGLLSLIIYRMRKWSIKQDTVGGTKLTFKMRGSSCWGLAIFGVGFSFAGIDFYKALDYTWFSTMWGVYMFAEAALSSMAMLIVTLYFLRKAGYLKKVTSVEHFHIMGKLMFAFVVFWAYISFGQFFLIWYANIPEETKFFLIRNTEGWNTMSIGLVLLHFVIPFVGLVGAWVKRNPDFLVIGAIYVLAVHIYEFYWIVIPERSISLVYEGIVIPWAILLDIVALGAVGCLWGYFYLRTFSGQSLFPRRDPRLLESINAHN
ncbi:MAG: hypothetical protein AAF555_05385 [Verrucomicrobiota bacterium]